MKPNESHCDSRSIHIARRGLEGGESEIGEEKRGRIDQICTGIKLFRSWRRALGGSEVPRIRSDLRAAVFSTSTQIIHHIENLLASVVVFGLSQCTFDESEKI